MLPTIRSGIVKNKNSFKIVLEPSKPAKFSDIIEIGLMAPSQLPAALNAKIEGN